MKTLKYLIAFTVLLSITGCGMFGGADCSGDSGNYGKDVKIGTYYSFRERHVNVDAVYNNQEHKEEYHSYSAYFKERLELRDDSTFSYCQLWEHYSDSNKSNVNVDTIEYMSGSYHIRSVAGEKWNSLILVSDSIYERNLVKARNTFIIAKGYNVEPYTVNSDSILLNVDLRDSCFSLASYAEPDDLSSCRDPYVSTSRVFCANTAMRDSSIVDVVEE